MKKKNTGIDILLGKKTDEAIESWLILQPHLDHFPEVAVDCYRLDKAFKSLKEFNASSFELR